ncbi:neuromedin-U receptor 2-like [Saccostrea echinata]|uniref:neuromedin-U receptor 2-like n=1 Tax=Saccostrea echinata TaxID=191078 RepID=UPI002A835A16|nr:neuromedin-U receptor 2-like [Saccostrea echinata]
MNITSEVTVSSPLQHTNFKTLEEFNDEKARQRLPTIIFLCILIAFGIIGNMVVLVVYTLRYRSSTFRTYILTLAAVDLLSCLIAMPVELVDNLYPLMFFIEGFCKGGRFLGHVFKIGSAFIILVMAVGRFKKICRPFSKPISVKQAQILCTIAIFVAILFAWPNAIIQGMRHHYLKGGVIGYDCSIDDKVKMTIYPFVYTIVLTVVYTSVFFSLVVLYTIVILKLQHHNQAEEKKHRVSPRITKIMIAITVAFILSYLPDCILDANSTFNKGNTLPSTPVVLGTLPLLARAYFVNNVINPVIYFVGESKFRRIIKLSMLWIFHYLFHRKKNAVGSQHFQMSDTFRNEDQLMVTMRQTTSSTRSQHPGNQNSEFKA